jgi:hypothetical protein
LVLLPCAILSSSQEAKQWWTSLADADRAGTFLYGFTAFIVSGTKA